MIAIRIGDQYLDLAPDSRIRLKLRSQLFSREFVTAGYSYPISLPLSNANRALLGHAERIGKSGDPTELDCTIELGGAYWRQAVLVLRSVSDGYDVDLRVPEDRAITLLREVRTRQLPQTYDFSLLDGSVTPFVADDIDAMHDRIADRLAPAEDTDIIFAPIRNTTKWGDRAGRYFDIQTGPGSDYPEINVPHEYVNHYDAEHPHPFLRYRFTAPVDRYYGELGPLPYLWAVVRHLLAEVGYKLTGDVFDNPEVRRQVVLNNVLLFSALITDNDTNEAFPNYGVDNASMKPLYPTVRLAELVPDMTGIELLVRLMKRYNAVPLFRSGNRLELRSLNSVLDDTTLFDLEPYATPTPDWQPDPVPGLELTEDAETGDKGRLEGKWDEARVIGTVDTPAGLSTLTPGNGDYARVRVDGKIYKYTQLPGGSGSWAPWADDFSTFSTGGEEGDSLDVGVGFTAMWRGTDTVATTPRDWLVPNVAMRLSDVESDWHSLGRNDATALRLLFYRGLQPDSEANTYPLLSNDVYDHNGTEIEGATMAEKLHGERGIYATWYQRWVSLLQGARTRSLPTRLPLHLLRNWPWDRKVYLQGHHYLVREIDVEFTTTGMGLPVLELVKLEAAGVRRSEDPCANCTGPQRVSFTILEGGGLGIITTSTHLGVCDPEGNFSIQAPDGEATEPPIEGDNYFFVFGDPGNYCVFPCNEAGVLDGTITGVDEGAFSQTTAALNVDSVADTLLWLVLSYAGLPTDWQPGVTMTALLRHDRQADALVTPLLSRMPNLNYLDLAENDIADTDAVLQHLIDGGQSNGYVNIAEGTNAVPDPTLVSALEGDGWTVIANE